MILPSKCSEVHVGPIGQQIQDCRSTESEQCRNVHCWVWGSDNDILTPIESYHLYDPFGHHMKHETHFNYDRIPAVVELCIQAGVDVPECPSRNVPCPSECLGKGDRQGWRQREAQAISSWRQYVTACRAWHPWSPNWSAYLTTIRHKKACREDSKSMQHCEMECRAADEVHGEGL